MLTGPWDPGAGASPGEIFVKIIPSGTGAGDTHNCHPPQQGGWKGDQTYFYTTLSSLSFTTNFIFNQNIPSHFSLFSRMKHSYFVKVNPRSEKYLSKDAAH